MNKKKYCFGVDVGGTTVKLGLFSIGGELLDKWEIKTNTAGKGEAILPDIAASIRVKLLEKQIQKDEILGIGMGIPAPVTEEGVIQESANLGWGYKEVKKELEELSGFPVFIGNDANVAALGEMWKGGGRGFKNMIMVTLGTGVGGGIIINEKIHTGRGGAGGEIGHMLMNLEEEDCCGCGNKGCLEQYSSATGIVRLAKKAIKEHKDLAKKSPLKEETVTAKDVFDQVKEKDELAMLVAAEFGNILAHALVILAAVIDTEAFVIGGGVSKAGEVLLDYIEKPFYERAFFANKDVEFRLATLGNDAGIYGAAKMLIP